MIVGAIVVALLAVGGLIAALNMGGDDKDQARGNGGTTPSASASSPAKAGHKGPDTSRTMETEKCKNPSKDWQDASKVAAPDFTYKNLASVKLCIQAAGGKYKIENKDEAVFGQDTVLAQFPVAGTAVTKDQEYTLTVSTGDPQ